MINEKELNAIKGVMHYLNSTLESDSAADLAFDVNVIDSNGDTIVRIERVGDFEYQLLFGGSE
jgi:hypothetical protein